MSLMAIGPVAAQRSLAELAVIGFSTTTCYLGYVVEPSKLKELEIYAKMSIPLVEKIGGTYYRYSYFGRMLDHN